MRANVIIERVLRDYPETRSSDRELYIQVWERYGFYMSEQQKAQFRKLPSSETIRRVRQKLQETGHYKAAETVKQHRSWKGMEVQQNMPQTRPEKVEALLERMHPPTVNPQPQTIQDIVRPDPQTLELPF